MPPTEPTSSESSGGGEQVHRDLDQPVHEHTNVALPHDYADLANRIERALTLHTPRHINRVIVLAEARSTQDEARARCGGEPGLMVIASRQTAGRGRLGRAWVETADAGIAATFVLDASHSPGRLSIIAGLAACLTIEVCFGICERYEPGRVEEFLTPLSLSTLAVEFARHWNRDAPNVGVRWPNDVVEINGDGSPARKLAGVLIERADNLSFVGIGLNVSQRLEDWPAELAGRAASLRQLGMRIREPGEPVHPGAKDRGDVATLLATTLNRLLSESPEALRTLWYARNALRNQSCRFVHNGEEYAGRVVAIDPENTIQLRDERRGIVHLPAQSTSLVHDATP